MKEERMKLNERIQDILEEQGWNYGYACKAGNKYFVNINTSYSFNNENYTLNYERDYEDTVWFDGTIESFIEGFKKLANDFDSNDCALKLIRKGENKDDKGTEISKEEIFKSINDIKELLCDTARELEYYFIKKEKIF